MSDKATKGGSKRLSLNTATNARRALARTLREYMLSDRDDRESSDFLRVIIHGLSELLADYRKEAEIDLATRVAGLEDSIKQLEAHRGQRAS